MLLYNLQNNQLEPLRSLESAKNNPITVYVCGITPYDTTHLGHAFTYTTADILIRYLEYLGYPVRYVQNVTDIDDDILRKAKQVGDDWIALGDRWTAHFIQDMITLNVRPPEHYPRATEVISEIIQTVQELITAGVAYEKNGSVYFQVSSWPEFGEIAGLDSETMLATANERGNNPDDPNKKDPLDFVLWQAQAPGEPSWDSPWGAGRPGWHIECSTMSTKYLGETIDIHSGGGDLLFPHHACEIAQVEPITGKKPFVQFWLHAAMVRHQGEKMSKSLGNLVMARELLQTFSPDALRLYLAMHHYQIEWSCDPGHIKWAAKLAERFYQAAVVRGGQGAPFEASPWEDHFVEEMNQNLNTPAALGVLDDLCVQTLVAAQAGQDVSAAQHTIRRLSTVFGLVLDAEKPETRVAEGWRMHLEKFKAHENQNRDRTKA
jgi:L-cysteine:1D-myo-inositol 2-amino-2-deoxy-alpha-D-glucopyranoside ligase